jgi:hypothetical protein
MLALWRMKGIIIKVNIKKGEEAVSVTIPYECPQADRLYETEMR